MKPDIIVVTAAYGHAQIAALGGQRALLPIIQQAGADGVEIRRELLDDAALADLPALARAVAQHQLHSSYSVPDTLFCDGGEINPRITHYVEEARQLNAQRLSGAGRVHRCAASRSVAGAAGGSAVSADGRKRPD
jgi:hypothetical protein